MGNCVGDKPIKKPAGGNVKRPVNQPNSTVQSNQPSVVKPSIVGDTPIKPNIVVEIPSPDRNSSIKPNVDAIGAGVVNGANTNVLGPAYPSSSLSQPSGIVSGKAPEYIPLANQAFPAAPVDEPAYQPIRVDYGRLQPAVVTFPAPNRQAQPVETFDWARSINEENYNETLFRPISIPNLKVAIK